MTRRAPDTPLRRRLDRAHARVRRALIARHALRAAAAVCVLLAALVSAGLALPVSVATASARLATLGLGAVAAAALAVSALAREWPRWDAWLERIEARFPDVRSWLRNALDLEAAPPAHVSAELAAAVRDETARRLDGVPLGRLAPGLEARASVIALAAAALALAGVRALAPDAGAAAWRTLWNPALATPAVALAVEPGDVTISPGAALAVRARVSGSSAAPRLLGDGPAPAPALESSAGGVRRWRFDLPPVTRARAYAVRVARVESPRYHIALAGEPRPVSFAITVQAPRYARLPAQTGTSTRGDVTALAGSVAHIEVTFDRDLVALDARLPDGRASGWHAITPRRWRGDVPVARDGEWRLSARAASGAGETRWRIAAQPDQPPVLTVARPDGDLDLPSGQLIPYDLLAQDDLGLSDVALEWRKDASSAWRSVPLAHLAEAPREARVAARWDASSLALLPGESGTFRFVAWDDDAVDGRQRAESPEFHVRFPSLSDLYESLDHRQENVQQALEHVADQAKELQKSLDRLERQPRTSSPQSPSSQNFERTEEVRKSVERQRALAQQVDQAAEDLRQSLGDAAERQAFHEDLQRKLREMSDLLRQVQSQEFRDALQRMQQALEKLDRMSVERTLPELQRENQELLKNLDRSLALLKQLRDEERMDALSRRAEELKQQQDALNREHEQAAESSQARDSTARSGLTERQQQAAGRTQELAKDAREAARTSEDQQAHEALQQAAQELEQHAAPDQQQAGEQSQSGEPRQAAQSGQQASESLSRAAQQMSESARRAQSGRDAAQLAAVRRAAEDLVSLSRSSEQNLQSAAPEQQTADAQTDLAEGVARVADSLAALGKQTPFLTPQVQQALGQAMQGLQQSGREMAQGSRARGEQQGRSASAALNAAVQALRASEAGMCQKPGQGQNGHSSGETMGQLGERQSRLNQRSREVARRLSEQLRLSAGDRDELRRLADEQQRIRADLEQVRRDEEARKTLLGRLDQTQQDMEKVEEQLREGRADDELEQRQTQILSRMLDAQRSIQRRDFDPEREARRGEDVARASAPELPSALLRENDRLRLGLLKAESDRYPARYRALVEAYLRSLNGSTR